MFSADSSILVIGSEEGWARLSQAATGAPLALPPGTNGARQATSFPICRAKSVEPIAGRQGPSFE
jgi:hypothetical protein